MLSRCYSAMFPLSLSSNDSLKIADPVHRNIFPAMCMVTYCDNSQSNCCSFAMWRCLLRHPPWLTWVFNGQIGRILPQGNYDEITKLRNYGSDGNGNSKKSKRLNKQNNNSARASRFSVHFLAVRSNYDVKWPNFKLPLLYTYDVKWPKFKFTWERVRQGELGHGPLCSSSNLISLLLSNQATWNNRDNVWKVVYWPLQYPEGNWSRNASRNCFWDRYRVRASQLLANFVPVLCNRPRSLCEN